MRNAILAAMLLAANMTPSMAAQPRNSGSTVNAYSGAQDARARKAVTDAGYRPVVLETVQDGNLFYTATKGNEAFTVTVTPSDKTFISTGLRAQDMGKPPAG